jgi:DnaJ-class molecular chaperone
MAKACSECGGSGQVPDQVPCPTCGGKGHILDENKKPKDCPDGCDWGQVETGNFVTCLNCGGTGKEPDLF